MIDIEPQVFDRISKAVRKSFPKAYVTGEYVSAPPNFPCVSVEESDNAVYRRTQTGSNAENHAALMYEVNVYSNKKTGRKDQAKKIMAVVDEEMGRMGFTRRFLHPVPNLLDSTIFRMTARYSAVVSQNEIIYRR